MGFFTRRERNELQKLAEEPVQEFVPHQNGRTDEGPAAGDIGPLLALAAGKSVQEIDEIIHRLQLMRERLSHEAARVQRSMVAYTAFSQTTLESTKVISEALRSRFPKLSAPKQPSPPEQLSAPEQQ